MRLRAILAAATVALMATPAFAASTTVQFDSSNGQSLTVTFDTNGTATANGGAPVAYTFDQEKKTICSVYEGQDVCVTFTEVGDTVGFKTNYTNTLGDSGTATITAVSE
ncbi:MAG: hypothetical protein ACOY4K_16655 [Pseudomonadota bacterium]